jgi:acetyltransferase-like isoleucine patch superfamily enzyme
MKTLLKKLLLTIGVINREKFVFSKNKQYLKKHSIGEYTYGTPSIVFPCEGAILNIGKFCSIANGVVIFLGGNHRTDWVTTYPFNSFPNHFPYAKELKGHPSTKGSVTIGNDVWIGSNATIMSGVTIADGAVIASEAVITKNIGPYEIWAGNPAKCIKKRFDDAQIIELLKIQWWNWPIDKINNYVGDLCQEKISLFISKHSK